MHRKAKICYTAGGILIYRDKVLLIKHKKLNMWLGPGGHVDDGEVPSEAAEREFYEETGLKVKAVDPFIKLPQSKSTPNFSNRYFPNPIVMNLHWVCRQNYRARVLGQGELDPKWPRGCEQHLGFFYLVELVKTQTNRPSNIKLNRKESTEFGWFKMGELDQLSDLAPSIKWEIKLAFRLSSSLKNK